MMYARTDEELEYNERINAASDAHRDSVEIFRRAADRINALYCAIGPLTIGSDGISRLSRQDDVWNELHAMIGEWC